MVAIACPTWQRVSDGRHSCWLASIRLATSAVPVGPAKSERGGLACASSVAGNALGTVRQDDGKHVWFEITL